MSEVGAVGTHCAVCDEIIDIPVLPLVDDEGAHLVFTEVNWADVWAHMWTHDALTY